MKILMLSWEYPPRVVGGISRVVHDLSHRLTQDGHEVTVVKYKDGNVPYFEDDSHLLSIVYTFYQKRNLKSTYQQKIVL